MLDATGRPWTAEGTPLQRSMDIPMNDLRGGPLVAFTRRPETGVHQGCERACVRKLCGARP
eukprot:5512429-Alexandrium_andersonii.AAC.1